MGNDQKKCKVLLKDADFFTILKAPAILDVSGALSMGMNEIFPSITPYKMVAGEAK